MITEIKAVNKEGSRGKENGRLLTELEKLRSRVKELEGIVLEYETKNKSLKTEHEKLKSFAYAAIHDIKHPTLAINMLVRRLRIRYGDQLDKQEKYCYNALLEETERINKLLNTVIEFIKSGEPPLCLEWVDMKSMLTIVKNEFFPQLFSRHVGWTEPQIIPNIKADKISIVRVFENLIDNALKHGGDRLTAIDIGYNESSDFHIISVADNGRGLPETEAEKIFTQFYRISRNIEPTDGTGLGLTAVKEIAVRHGGEAWTRPVPNGGAIFYVSIAKNL